MKKGRASRLTALILSMTLFAGMTPQSAFAAETETQSAQAEAAEVVTETESETETEAVTETETEGERETVPETEAETVAQTEAVETEAAAETEILTAEPEQVTVAGEAKAGSAASTESGEESGSGEYTDPFPTEEYALVKFHAGMGYFEDHSSGGGGSVVVKSVSTKAGALKASGSSESGVGTIEYNDNSFRYSYSEWHVYVPKGTVIAQEDMPEEPLSGGYEVFTGWYPYVSSGGGDIGVVKSAGISEGISEGASEGISEGGSESTTEETEEPVDFTNYVIDEDMEFIAGFVLTEDTAGPEFDPYYEAYPDKRTSGKLRFYLPQMRDQTGISSVTITNTNVQTGRSETIDIETKYGYAPTYVSSDIFEDRDLQPGTSYEYELTATDTLGNSSEVYTFSLATALPEIGYVSPSEGSTVGARNPAQELYFTANNAEYYDDYNSDFSLTAEFFYKAQDSEEWLSLPIDWSYTGEYHALWDLSELPSGQYDVKYKLTDADGGVCEKIVTYTVDNDLPPQVEGLTATENYNNITLSWPKINDGKSYGYRLFRRLSDDEEWMEIKHVNTWNVSSVNTYIDNHATPSYTRGLVYGQEYQYMVRAYKKINDVTLEGEDSRILKAKLKEDKTSPEMRSLRPENHAVITGDHVNFYASAVDTDSGYIAGMTLEYRVGTNGDWQMMTQSKGQNWISCDFDTTQEGIPDGAFAIRARALDQAGNASEYITYTYIVDNTPPTPPTGLAVTGTATTVNIIWNDVPEDDRAYFVVQQKGDSGFYDLKTVRALGAGISGLTPGNTYTFRVLSVDRYGNRSDPSEEISYTAPNDTTAPVVTNISPSGAYFNDSLYVCFTVEDDYDVEQLKLQVSRDRSVWADLASISGTDVSLGSGDQSGQGSSGQLGGQTHVVKTDVNGSAVRYKFTYNLSLETLGDILSAEDGPLYLRGIPVDSAGNEGLSDSSAPYAQYMIDTEAPAAPQVTAQPYKNQVHLTWTAETGGDTDHYRIYRTKDGEAGEMLLKNKWHYTDFYDDDIDLDVQYAYRVEAVDFAGNVSTAADPVSIQIQAAEDKQDPVIHYISPESGSVIGGSDATISFLVEDDTQLAEVTAAYGRKGAAEQKTDTSTCDDYYLDAHMVLDLTEYADGDTLSFVLTAADAAGNAVTQTNEYTLDLAAPEVTNLEVQSTTNQQDDGESVWTESYAALSWDVADAPDLAGCYVYQTDADGSSKKQIDSISADSGVWQTSVPLSVSGSYYYMIEAVDSYGNTSESEVVSLTFKNPDDPLVTAYFTAETIQEVNTAYTYNASASTAPATGTIAGYHFDFGDGTEADHVNPTHSYQETGNYTVKLTVTDIDGNTAEFERQVQVRDSSQVAKLDVYVIDDTGTPVSGMPVYFDLGQANEIKKTGSNGHVVFSENPGTYTIGAYQSGYLPTSTQAVLRANETVSVKLRVTQEEIVTGTFDIKRMSLAEIRAAGINLSDPANMHVMRVTVALQYSNAPSPVNVSFTARENSVSRFSSGGHSYAATVHRIGGGSGNKNKINDNNSHEQTSDESEEYIVALIELPIEAKILKEFFNVKLYILNHASEDFVLKDNMVSLNVPEGMTLMERESLSEAVTTFDELKGQETHTLDWIIRGDKAGDYKLSADYSAILDAFEEPVNVTFESSEIKVYGTDAVKLIVNLDQSIRYQTLYFSIGLKNMMPYDLNFPAVNPLHLIDPDKIVGGQDGEYLKAELLETWIQNEAGRKMYLIDDLTLTPERKYLAAGETLYRKYVIHGVVDDNSILNFHDYLLKNLDNISPDQIEVNVKSFDLYESPDADEIIRNINTTNVDDFSNIFVNDNYAYYQCAKRYSGSGDVVNKLLNGKIKDVIDPEKQKVFMQGIFVEMVNEVNVESRIDDGLESFYEQMMDQYIDYLDSFGDLTSGNTIPKEVTTILKHTENYGQLWHDLLATGDWEAFNKKTQELVKEYGVKEAGAVIGSMQEAFEAFSPEIADGMSDYLKGLNFTAEVSSEVMNSWKTNAAGFNAIVELQASYDEAEYLLSTIAASDYAEEVPWLGDIAWQMLKDMKSSTEELEKKFLEQYKAAAVGGAIAEVGAGVVVDALLDWAVNGREVPVAALSAPNAAGELFPGNGVYVNTLGIKIKVVLLAAKAVYKAADKGMGMSDFWEMTDYMRGIAAVSNIFIDKYSYAIQVEKDNEEAVHALKYLIATRIIGERCYAEEMQKREDKDYLLDLYTIGKDSEYSTVSDFISGQNSMITGARDNIFNNKRKEFMNRPKAPQVVYDYETQTAKLYLYEALKPYEYSIDDGAHWLPCDEGSCKVAPVYDKVQYLLVRKASSPESIAGEAAQVEINAQKETSAAIMAKRQSSSSNRCILSGFTSDESVDGVVYEYFFTDDRAEADSDWSIRTDVKTFTTTTGGSCGVDIPGSVSAETPKYIVLRKAATAVDFATVGRAVLIDIDASVVDPNPPAAPVKLNIGSATVTGIKNLKWTGKALTQSSFKVTNAGKTLKEGTDYTVSYKNNTNVGTATILFTGKGDYTGTLSKNFRILYPCATPSLPSLTNVSGGVKLTWSKVTGAVKYRIFRKTGSGSWAKLADTTAVSYTDKTVKAGTKYSYTVRCITADGKSYTSAYNTTGKVITYLLPAPKLGTVTNVNGGVKFTWTKASGVVKYRIFRKTGSGSWAKLADTTAVTYTDKTVANGTTYSYTVRGITADGKTYTSAYNTTGKKITYVLRPTISSLTSPKSKQMLVKWGKNAKATGYQIQYSTSSTFASGNKTVTVKDAKTVSKAITSLLAKKRYYVRVRTYMTVSGTNYYSAWSAAKNVVTK